MAYSKNLLFLLISHGLLFNSLQAQPFAELDIGIAKIAAKDGAWGDYDNDGDLDLYTETKLYENIGSNNYSERTDQIFKSPHGHCTATGDYDNDGDLDILLVYETEQIIYKNNSGNSFTEILDIPVMRAYLCSAAWGDYDNDGDLDFLLAGGEGISNTICILYRNDGHAQFTEMQINFTPFRDGDIAWGDYDSDGDLDVLMAGEDFSGNRMTKIYSNEGNDVFTDIYANILGVFNPALTWGDYDSDGDLDILLSGNSFSEGNISKVYKNNGDGNFEEQTNILLEGISNGSVAWGDYDIDGDLDILLSGENNSGEGISKVYSNYGGINFVEETDIPLIGLTNSSVSWGDSDNDGDLDILLTGSNSGVNISRIYRNDCLTANNIPEAPTNLNSKVIAGNAVLSWDRALDDKTLPKALTYNIVVSKYIDSLEILSPMADLITGYRQLVSPGNTFHDTSFIIYNLEPGQYYWSVQAIDNNFEGSVFSAHNSFTVLNPFSIEYIGGLTEDCSSVAWGDYDNDGDLDFILSGSFDQGVPVVETQVYKNNGDNSFTYQNISLPDLSNSSIAWGDYDNDDDLDILLTGDNRWEGNANISKIYMNNGDNSFTEQTNIFLTGVLKSSVAWGDYDNDGDLDILLTGESLSEGNISKIYKNNGNNNFEEQTGISLTGVSNSYVSWGDYDNDGDLDILLAGESISEGIVTKVYKNNGNESFTDQSNISLAGIKQGSLSWGDYDNDGDLDILLVGINNVEDNITKIYRNDGNDTFTDVHVFLRGMNGAAHWADYDNDGDLDILLAGKSGGHKRIEIYANNGNNDYTLYADVFGLYDYIGPVDLGDYDGDNDLDIIYTDYGIRVYKNNGNWENSRPVPPINLKSQRIGYGILLLWDASKDDQTPVEALSYNIRVGLSSGSNNIVASMSDSSGYRRIPQMGNCNLNTSWILDSLAEGNYYWSVQAIDHTLLGGEWSEEETFIISVIHANFETDTVCFGAETSLSDLSLSSGDPIIEWKWDFGDGTTSTLQHPVHTYATADTFPVRLIAISSQYSDTIVKDIIVLPKPAVDFSADLVCQGTATSFLNTTNSNSLNIVSWTWDFGDGNYSSLENPVENGYLNVGDYQVSLKEIADNGCVDSIKKIVTIAGFPPNSLSVDGSTQFCLGDSVTLVATYNELYDFQWLLGGVDISGADSSKYKADQTGVYAVRISNKIGNCISTSNLINVNVIAAPDAPTITTNGPISFCKNDSVILSVAYNPDYSYKWKLNSGAAGTDTNFLIAKTNGIYHLEVSNSGGCAVFSNNQIEVIVHSLPDVPVISLSGPTTFCQGDSVQLDVSPTPTYSYQWKNSLGALTGETVISFIATSQEQYYLEVSSTDGCKVNTLAVSVVVKPVPTAPYINASGPPDFCEGDSISLSIPYHSDLNFQWKSSANPVGLDSNIFIIKETGLYSVEVTNSYGCSVSSTNNLNLTVNQLPKVPTVNFSGPTSFCEGDSVELSVLSNPTYLYQWKSSSGNIDQETGTKLAINSTEQYYLEVYSAEACRVETNPINVTVNPIPVAPTIIKSSFTEFCEGDSLILSVSENVAYTYQWRLNGGGVGMDTNILIARTSGTYWVDVSNESGCLIGSINQVDVTVNKFPIVPVISLSGPPIFCHGRSIDLSVPSVPNHTYQWKKSLGSILAETGPVLTVNSTEQYSLKITNDGGCSVETDTLAIVVNPVPGKPVILHEGLTSLCSGDSVVISVFNIPEVTFHWFKNGNPISVTDHQLIVKESGDYSISISNLNNCYSEISEPVTIKILPSPQISSLSISGAKTFCEGDSLLMGVDFNKDHFYKWYKNGLKISNASDNQFEVKENGTYYLRVSNSSDCSIRTGEIAVSVLDIPPALTINVNTSNIKKGFSDIVNLCEGDSIRLKLQENLFLNYDWQLDGNPLGISGTDLYAKTTGTYTARITNENNCSSITGNDIELRFNFSPKKPILNSSGKLTVCTGENQYLSVTNIESGVQYSWTKDGSPEGNKVNELLINDSGLYRVTALSSLGCETSSDGTSVILIEEILKPELTFIEGSSLVCPSEKVVVSVTEPDDSLLYKLKHNGVLLSPLLNDPYKIKNPGFYSVTASRFHCYSESDPIEIAYKSAPKKPQIIAEGPNIWYLACSNDSADFYRWFREDFLVTEGDECIYVANQNYGNYRVEISDEEECYTSSDVIRIPDNIILNMIDEDLWDNLRIYPNPTPGLFSLEMDNAIMGELAIDIFKENGSKVINIKFLKETTHFITQIDLSEQPSAIYLINLILNEYRTNRKLVVE